MILIVVFIFSFIGCKTTVGTATTTTSSTTAAVVPGLETTIEPSVTSPETYADTSSSAGPRIAAGNSHVLALLEDGSLWAWGNNGNGQLGEGYNPNDSKLLIYAHPSPIRVGSDTDWAAIAVGNVHSLALKKDGSLWAWGDNKYGQLGDGTNEMRTQPALVGSDSDWTAVWAGGMSSYAMKGDGTLWVWGGVWSGSMGGTLGGTNPTRIEEPGPWKAVACAGGSFAIKADGTAWVFGSVHTLSPVQIGKDEKWVGLGATGSTAGGSTTAFLVKSDGTVWMSGNRQFGDAKNWKMVAVGDRWRGIKTDGSLWAWRDGNIHGELGEDVFGMPLVRVGTDADWTNVEPGYEYTIAVKSDGTIWGWGDNRIGQVGVGSKDDVVSEPMLVTFPTVR